MEDATAAPPASAPRRPRAPRRLRGGVVAIVGVHGAAARRVLRRLEEDERYTRLVLIDARAPRLAVRRSVHHAIDLAQPLADERVAEILRSERVETIVHLALHEVPVARAAEAHELETFGTMNLLNATAHCLSHGAPLRSIVALSTAMVYGASATNPAYLTEDFPLRGGNEPGFVRDKVDAERQLAEFRSQSKLPVCVLRPCWTLGPERSIAGLLLRQSPAITVLGFDPLMQLLHVEDLVDVLKQAIDRRRDGCFNLAGDGVLPLSALFRAAGRCPLRMPSPLAHVAADLLWRSRGIGTGVPLEYLRHLWLVDCERARRQIGFAPRYPTRSVIQAFARAA